MMAGLEKEELAMTLTLSSPHSRTAARFPQHTARAPMLRLRSPGRRACRHEEPRAHRRRSDAPTRAEDDLGSLGALRPACHGSDCRRA